MYSHILSKFGVVGIGSALKASSMLLAVYLTTGLISTVSATPLPPLLPGFKDDVGTSYFAPEPFSVGIEIIDPFEPFTTFGFFFQGDPGTTISLFDDSDLSFGVAASQVSLVDFVGGFVYDLDTVPGDLTLESTFTPTLGDIGFFLNLGGAIIYSDAALNGGIDLFSAWQNEDDPTLWGLAFEGINPDGSQTLVNISLVGGISAAVPEPSILALLTLGGSFLLVGSLRRRKFVDTGK